MDAAGASNGIGGNKTLSDSARELEEARAAKRKYEEVAVITGEEDEQNALQIFAKLFTFDKVQGEIFLLFHPLIFYTWLGCCHQRS